MACGAFLGPARLTQRRFPKHAPDYRGEAARREIKRHRLRHRDRARVRVGRGLHERDALGDTAVAVPWGIADRDQFGHPHWLADRHDHGYQHADPEHQPFGQ